MYLLGEREAERTGQRANYYLNDVPKVDFLYNRSIVVGACYFA